MAATHGAMASAPAVALEVMQGSKSGVSDPVGGAA